MTRDDIIRLAQEAAGGMLSYDGEGNWRLSESEVERFAALVAAAEQPKPKPVTDCEMLARLAVIEARLAGIQATLAVHYPPLYGAGRRDCGCAWNVVCNNIACPRRVTVTFNTGGP